MIMISMPMNYDNWYSDYMNKKKELEDKGYRIAPLHAASIYKKEPEYNYPIENKAIMYMANSFARMAISDTIYFCGDWENARGCRLEHQAAKDYGLKIMYENPRS